MTTGDAFEPALDPRRRELLEAALAVFLRFGFRKTSMDEVARAARISRQGLYLHFKTKEELFQATIAHLLRDALQAAARSLGDASRPLEQRLLGAFDAVVGRFVGMLGADTADLAQAGSLLVGDMITEHEAAFAEAVAKTLRGSGLLGCYRAAGLNARQLADTLHATARGLKYGCSTRAEFLERMEVAVRALCAPLGAAP
jgi:TetR/AcrR family transcriptional regulator, regulator of autoinduction and epiphytic fitness